MNLLVAIPSRSNWSGLVSVVYHCEQVEPIEKILVYDNGYDDERRAILDNMGIRVDANGWSFYKMWNDPWMRASVEQFDAVALLNDDITLAPGSLAEAFKVLMSSEDIGLVGLNYERRVKLGVSGSAGSRPASGSYRNHGIGGHAFLVKASTWGIVPPIDERYHLWYGDDEMFANMAAFGYELKIALGAPVDHEESTTTNKHPELLAKTALDRELFESKFG